MSTFCQRPQSVGRWLSKWAGMKTNALKPYGTAILPPGIYPKETAMSVHEDLNVIYSRKQFKCPILENCLSQWMVLKQYFLEYKVPWELCW